MRRLLTIMLGLFLAASLGLGAAAHACEVAAPDHGTSMSLIAHFDGDGDQVPADADKAFPHHHANCHGHDIGVPTIRDAVRIDLSLMPKQGIGHDLAIASHPSDPALRPPQA